MKSDTPKPNLKTLYEYSEASRKQFPQFQAEPDTLLQISVTAAERGDVEGAMVYLCNTLRLAFVLDNIAWLKSLGKYEKTLFDSYTITRLNFQGWQLALLKQLFNMADRPALLAAGDPLPGAGPFTVFRGVAGKGAKRRLRGISWTADRDRAIWFAKRFAGRGLETPAVFCAVITAAQVYAYTNDRKEQEFLCDIGDGDKLRRVWPGAAGLNEKGAK
jgi:hypothetical protein